MTPPTSTAQGNGSTAHDGTLRQYLRHSDTSAERTHSRSSEDTANRDLSTVYEDAPYLEASTLASVDSSPLKGVIRATGATEPHTTSDQPTSPFQAAKGVTQNRVDGSGGSGSSGSSSGVNTSSTGSGSAGVPTDVELSTRFARQLLKVASGRHYQDKAKPNLVVPMLDEDERTGDAECEIRGLHSEDEAGPPYPRGPPMPPPQVVEDDDEADAKRKRKKKDKALKGPTQHRWNLYPLFLLFWYLGAAGFYIYVRANELPNHYGAFILAVEILGMTSFLPYAILLTRGIYPTGSPGLPPAEDNAMSPDLPVSQPARQGSLHGAHGSFRTALPPSRFTFGALPENQALLGTDAPERFHVRVCVPCYKEPLEVVAATLDAARSATLPANTRRTIYLCDDGNDPVKKALVDTMGPDVVYVTGRKRKHGEINGKSANLNNCLKNVIYASYPKDDDGDIDWAEISNRELLVVFDADMCAKPEFFLRLLEVMADDQYALVLTPQSFHNISRDADLFNNINKQFWECWLPGAFGWGYIACTGTNFCLRVRALAHCGWFPDYTITEDYALGMELKSRGYKATYLMLYLAVGEAPDEIRNVFRQRSRWNKGHFQVFFSGRNPFLYPGLPFFQRFWYSYAAWAPMCTVFSIPVFIAVPFMSIAFGLNPITITFKFVLAATLFYTPQALISNYSYAWGDWKLIWFANGSNTVLWFTYCKALFNSLVARMGMKVVAFKVTEKKQTTEGAAMAAALQPQGSLLRRGAAALVRVLTPRRARPADQPLLPTQQRMSTMPTPRTGAGAGAHPDDATGPAAKPLTSATLPANLSMRSVKSTSSVPGAPVISVGGNAHVRGASPLADTEAGKKDGWQRFKAVVRSFKPAHIKEFDEMFDPLVLLLLFLFSSATFAFGIWETARTFNERATVTFALSSPVHGSPYLIIATLWAFFNCIFPYLFLHYCVTAGATFKFAAKFLMILSHLILFTTLLLVWLLIPTEFDVGAPLAMQTSQYYPNQVLQDANGQALWLQGLNATAFSIDQLDTAFIAQQSAALAAAGNPSRRSLAATQFPADFDPAALTDDELHGPGALAAWQRSLLQASADAASAAASLPPGLDLSGGLLVKDHVKYGQPMGYAITQLSWALLQYPKGFTAAQRATTKQVIRRGAEYLVRCLLKTTDGKRVFVAQVGDPVDYLVVEDMLDDPAAVGKIWTSPAQDPFLNGQKPRKVWVLDENHVGSDLLANVAAGLAAASMVLQSDAPAFSQLALDTAKQVYTLASIGADQPGVAPNSYCDFIPCTANVTISKSRRTVPVSLVLPTPSPPVAANSSEPLCYFADFLTPTCQTFWTVDACSAVASKTTEVYRTKDACCARLIGSRVWAGLQNPVQGICALPPGQTQCYIPDKARRTCVTDTINNATGLGCTGRGLEVYASQEACCNYLVQQEAILPDAGKYGTGLCARVALDANFTQCYVPSLTNRTCMLKTGQECAEFGLATQYADPSACCDDLLNQLLPKKLLPLGICKIAGDVNATVLGQRRRGRALQQQVAITITTDGTNVSSTSPALPPAVTPTVDPGSIWQPPSPPPLASQVSCNAADGCDLRPVLETKTVTFYNSTTTLDDMAWGGAWLFKASGDRGYLGLAQHYLERHYKEEISPQTLNSDRTYYVSDWNNLAWATNMLLLQLTGRDVYSQRMRTLLNAWVVGKNVPSTHGGLPPGSNAINITVINTPANYTDPATNTTYYVLPECIATATYEIDCADGIDNDCDGNIDKADVDCGLFPMLYTSKNLAYSQAPSLPHSAAVAWLSMLYASTREHSAAQRLRCWALGQVAYMMGASPDTHSYIVGYGDSAGIVQHRASSCPPGGATCDWDNGYWPTLPNPQLDLIRGALLSGPNYFDQSNDLRSSADTQTSLDGTAPLTGVLAGLKSTGTQLRSCELMQGLYQRVFTSGGDL